jgi:hypothetical protein
MYTLGPRVTFIVIGGLMVTVLFDVSMGINYNGYLHGFNINSTIDAISVAKK